METLLLLAMAIIAPLLFIVYGVMPVLKDPHFKDNTHDDVYKLLEAKNLQ